MSNEILLKDIWTSKWGWRNQITVPYDNKTVSRQVARGQIELALVEAQRIREHIAAALAGTKPLYIKLTSGRYAGTIARISALPEFTIVCDDINHPPATCQIKEVSSKYSSAWYIVGSITTKYGYDKPIIASVGDKVVLEWWLNKDGPLKTARPVLLLDYEGEEVLVKGKDAKTEIEVVLKDRFGRDVRVNDLVIIGHNRDGTLIVGKIAWMSDARTIRLKHVGNKELIQLPNVQDNQILLLTDDIKQVLMMEKLRGL